MSDVRVVETDQSDSDIYVKVVWGLYVVSILFGFTHIVGVILAYIWRGEAPVGSLYRGHFDAQIRLFWKYLLLSLVAVFLFLVLFFISISSASGDVGFGIQTGFITTVFFVSALAIHLYFDIMSIIGLIKAFGNKPYY